MPKHEEVRIPAETNSSAYPTIGASILGLGAHLEKEGKLNTVGFERLREDTVEIVRKCRRFSGSDGHLTGLVVGYVQSGKTMSMTAVSALARDNGCRIVIVLAGVTTNLLDQNANRFRTDLRAASGHGAWRIINSSDWSKSPKGDPDVHHLQKAVLEWKNPAFKETDKQTFLVMVLKQHGHLDALARLLKSVDLRGVPALILDDEADQAGLNTKPNSPDPSTTYDRIRRVREAVPNHTYLQYTATPQAPLLIALDDMLSPAFAELVRPGDGYTGGLAFFGPAAPAGLVRPIPPSDLFKPGAPPPEPPSSLTEALAVFFVACAVSAKRGKPATRSMLIHPSSRRTDHQKYVTWTTEIIRRWGDALRSEPQDRAEALEEFETAYKELQKTSAELPPFVELHHGIELALSRVEIKEVNGEDGSEVDWENADAHILVGGEKLNRGFTVEGLMVTYMPRGTGEWNADTIQQRARFFGYKQSYLSICRLYLDPEVISAFRSYVSHEEDVRKQLNAHRGRPLREWRRAFFIDAALRPTRRNVISDDYHRIQKDQLWFIQRHPHDDAQAVQSNLAAIKNLIAGVKFEIDEDAFYKHQFANVPLARLRDGLVGYVAHGSDRAGWYAQLIALTDVCDTHPDAQALLLKMAGERLRSETKDGSIPLHQGASSKVGQYPGDNKMLDPVRVTLQIHTVDIKDGPKGVPAIALHIPKQLRRDDVGVLVPRQ